MPKPQPYVPQSRGARIAHARRLLGVREGKDVTVPDLAERVEVTAASVYNWEADVSEPGKTNRAKLAAVLGVSEAYIDYGIQTEREAEPPLTTKEITDFVNEELAASRAYDAERAAERATPPSASPAASPAPGAARKAAGGTKGKSRGR
jgi:transcriptional regulator with XRE-family HTH domain